MVKISKIISDYTLDKFLYDLVIILFSYLYVFITIAVPVYLKKKEWISKFIARKIVHLYSGLVVLIVPFFILPLHAVYISLSITVMTYFSSRDSSVKQLQELYHSIGEEAEEKVGRLQGPFHYAVSITVLITIFSIFAPDRLYFPICGILIMIISDTFAAIIGKKFGRIILALPYTGSSRTLEGSFTFFLSAFLLCFSAFYFYGLGNPVNHNQQLLTLKIIFTYSLITSLAGTLIELFSPSTLDDLTVPIVSTIVIHFLAFLV
jgi:dolichol kinase